MKRLINNLLPRRNLDKLYLFVHLPKCAGTSMLKMLSEIGQQRFVVVAGTKTKREAINLLKSKIRERNIELSQLDLIAGRNVFFGMHEVSSRTPYYFTFLREPIERFISQYSYLAKCAGDPENDSYGMACERVMVDGKIISIREFVERNQSRNLLTMTLAAASSNEETDNSWWQIDPRVAPDKAKWMLEQMSFIGFVNQFESDSRFIFDKLKFTPKFHRTNVSQSNKVQVDADTMTLIRDANELDLELYEFAKQIAAKS